MKTRWCHSQLFEQSLQGSSDREMGVYMGNVMIFYMVISKEVCTTTVTSTVFKLWWWNSCSEMTSSIKLNSCINLKKRVFISICTSVINWILVYKFELNMWIIYTMLYLHVLKALLEIHNIRFLLKSSLSLINANWT